MTDNPALKDMFNQDSVGALADALASEYPSFPQTVFIKKVFDANWQDLALKARVRHITLIISDFLPQDYQDSLEILIKTLPHLSEQGFEKMIFPDFVEVFGQEELELSLDALEEITKHISGEFAIRPLISGYQSQTMARMLEWANHPHPGVRRLASEGCRPRLPWGIRLNNLIADPFPILPILEILKDDDQEEIRRSVANNLNDISKDNPEFVVKVLAGWQNPEDEQRSRLTKHALRTLIKAGHAGAMELLGFSTSPDVEVSQISIQPAKIRIGEDVTFSFYIKSTGSKKQPIMVDYLVYFMRANGNQTAKVFKLSQNNIQPGEMIKITKKHSFKPISTRKYYPGKQSFQPQINGKLFPIADLELKPEH